MLMAPAEKLKALKTRSGGDALGLHRVLEPKGVFPQAALRLDNSLPIFPNELLIEVEKLNLDSASFRQISEEAQAKPAAIAARIHQITQSRGKMHNPVTDSGGMLMGTVAQVGERSPLAFKPGDKIVTLVSLTLTPLFLEKIISMDLAHGQIEVKGRAILFAHSVAAPLPQDLSESAALSLFDVCGAPLRAARTVKPGEKVLILGAGKAGILSAFAVLEKARPDDLWLCDVDSQILKSFLSKELKVPILVADARYPALFRDILKEKQAPPFDLVINTCNSPKTETSSLLALKPGGRVLFFNMATNFQAAVLSAEGMGLDAELLMGNGYAEGHWQYALQLVQKNPKLKLYFEGGSL